VSPLLPSTSSDFFHILRESLREGLQVLTGVQIEITKKIVEKISARSYFFIES